MKANFIVALISVFMIIVFSCDIENNSIPFNLNCNLFNAGLINYDNEIVNAEIAKLVQDLNAAPTNADKTGHYKNFEILINRINRCEDITAELLAYASIKTNPLQSEILIRTDSSGVLITRILDILTPENSKLEFANIHEDYSVDEIKLQKTDYKGCFTENPKESLKSTANNVTDTLFYAIDNDSLTLNVIKNYNCCGLLKDSVVIENLIVSIYISDTCEEYCECRCMCDFDFQYQFTDFWHRNIRFNVYVKELNENSYLFWKGVLFIDEHD